MVQIENEYENARPANNYYMEALHKIFLDAGFDVPLFICDPFPTRPGFLMPGVLAEQNGLRGPASAALLDGLGDFPVYVPEVYTAWFLGWGAEPSGSYRSRSPLAANLGWINILLNNKYSFCLYMFFGGTNYGFYSGCLEFLPLQTSYDYDAPVDEAGRTTEKYRAMRELLAQRLNLKLPDPPPEPSVIEIPAFKLTQAEPLLATLPDKPTLVAAKPVSMEDLDQDYGFVLYRKKFPNGVKGTLELKQAMDYSIVMANGKVVGKSFIGYGPDTNKIALDETGPVTLDILVYNLGRVSVITSPNTQWRARKGLIDGASLDGADLSDWEMYSLPYAEGVKDFKAAGTPPTGPAFYRGTFTLDKLGGSFLDMRNWSFGAVWVNGHNLGRFWDVGSQRALFVPQSWLKQGENEIVVLELNDAPKNPEISGVTNMIREPVKPFPVDLTRANAY
jgi:beta-galactosidase